MQHQRASFTPMNRFGQQIKRFCLHRYPPKVYVFYPLYKWFRRRWGLPMAVSNLSVWVVSGVLHGAVLGSCGSPVAGMFFAVIFFALGVVSTIVVLRCKRTSHEVLRAIRVRTR